MPKLFDLSLQLSGYPISEGKKHLEQIVDVPEAEFETFLEQTKKEIVHYHLENNSFYKSFVGSRANWEWENLPVMQKKDLQRPIQERLSAGYTVKNVFINKTSGSSGNPLVFARDKQCHALIWANIIRRFEWHGIDFNHSLQARFYGISLDVVARAKVRLKDWLSNRYRFNIFDLSEPALGKILLKFRKTRFDYINGYTGSIVAFANFLKQQNIILKAVCPTLKVCVVTSEMLFETDRQLLESQFGIPIVNEYGSAELEIIAFENPEGAWIVNSETLLVEILDENDTVLPYGKEGRIVVTSLYNKAHPMIRYDVGDIGILDQKSRPSKLILRKLIGRTNDMIFLPSGKKAAGMTFYAITKKLFDDSGSINDFIVLQLQLDTFEIQYTSESVLSIEEQAKIKLVFEDYLEGGLQLIFIKKDVIPRSASGKLKQFHSLLPK